MNLQRDMAVEVCGSAVADGALSETAFMVDLDDEHAKMQVEMPIKRFTFAIRDKVLSLTDDDGQSASIIKIEDSNGEHSVHRAFDIDPSVVQKVIDDFDKIYKDAIDKYKCNEDLTENEEFYSDVISPFMATAAKHCPHLLSILLTQYCRGRLDETVSWEPTEAMLKDLTWDEMICTISAMKSLCAPWQNTLNGQVILSINGRAGAGKTSLINLIGAWFDDPKSKKTFKSVISLPPQEKGPNVFKAFINENLCYKGIFPYVYFKAADRMKNFGTYSADATW